VTRNPLPTKSYLSIVAHYEACLERHGDCHLGVDWPRAQDVDARYRVMLGVIPPDGRDPARPVRLLDFGCGAGHFYDFLGRTGVDYVQYFGLDLSEKFVRLCRAKYPGAPFYCQDVLEGANGLPRFDFAVMNGVFTEKRALGFAEMFAYFRQVVRRVFAVVDRGIAFNVMSKQVDWEREELFHLPLDELAWFLKREITRHFVIRNDYGLYEYTAYAYREPIR
jgi:SAM-dependent methyltransferase